MKRLSRIQVYGGKTLHGTITIQGSKNAALPMMAASLLHRGVSVLEVCPKISDVFCMEEILQSLGAVTWWKDHDLYLDCTRVEGTEISGIHTCRMRSSVILLGALLGRKGAGTMGYPGGCIIGKRPIDLHLYALNCLGAKVKETEECLSANCPRLTGSIICFPARSVGATEQAILAAVLAEGTTRILNGAKEPEICWLCQYLRGMGAQIRGEGTECLEIRGVKELHGGRIKIPCDRIVAGTYLCAAAATRGSIVISNPPEKELDAFLEVYQKMGGQCEYNSGKLVADARNARLSVPYIETREYPGFPTDLQSPLMAVLATAEGCSRIQENLFENRFRIVEELNRMGAHIKVWGNMAEIEGTESLHGTSVQARELRGGAALMIAALSAEDCTEIGGYSYIRRGYEDICRDITALGGSIRELRD